MGNNMIEQITGKLKQQFEKATHAGRGLAFRVTESCTKQIENLIKEGEAKQNKGETVISQVKKAIGVLPTAKQSVPQIRLAAIGLMSKTLENSGSIYSNLVKAGESKSNQKPKKAKAA